MFFLIMLAFSCIALHESNSTIVPMHAQTLPLGNSLAVVVCLYVCFSEHTEILFNLSMIIENTVLVNQEKNKYKTAVLCSGMQVIPIGNPPVTTAGLLHPTLLAAETLKTNSSQFCTTPPYGVL